MFTIFRMLGLAAALLAAPGTGAAESGGFLKVPQEVWTNINRFVFLAALDVNAAPGNPEYPRRTSALPSWPEVYAASLQWSEKTFPELQQLAAEVVQDDVGARLQGMVQAAETAARGGDRGPFDAAASVVEGKLAALLRRVATIKGQIDRLDAASRTVRRESAQLATVAPALRDIEVRAEQASGALGAAGLGWAGLQSDVTELRRVVDKAQGVDTDWYTRIGIKRWADVAGDARAFLTDMQTQERYLRGEDYYDNCGVRPDQWYTLAMPTLTGRDGFLGNSGQVGDVRVLLTDYGPLPPSVWRFVKLGKGWWQLHNQHFGSDWALDGGRGTANLVSTRQPMTSGRYWRLMPGGGDRCYLVNSFEGAWYALETLWPEPEAVARLGFAFRVRLQSVNQGEGQLWSFRPWP